MKFYILPLKTRIDGGADESQYKKKGNQSAREFYTKVEYARTDRKI